MLLNPERPNPACQRCPTVANRMATMRYWNIARQRHYRSSARCCWTLRVSVDRAAHPSPNTPGKPRLLGSHLTLRWREMDSNFQYASTVRWHRATDLPLPPTVKRRSAGRPPPMTRPRSEAQRGSVRPAATTRSFFTDYSHGGVPRGPIAGGLHGGG